MCIVSGLVFRPAKVGLIGPPAFSDIQGKRVEVEAGSVYRTGVESRDMVDVVLPCESPVLVDPNGVVPGWVCLLIDDTGC